MQLHAFYCDSTSLGTLLSTHNYNNHDNFYYNFQELALSSLLKKHHLIILSKFLLILFNFRHIEELRIIKNQINCSKLLLQAFTAL